MFRSNEVMPRPERQVAADELLRVRSAEALRLADST